MKAEWVNVLWLAPVKVNPIRPFTVAGAAQVKRLGACGSTVVSTHGVSIFLLPVELQPVNHAASTNNAYSKS